MQSLNTLKKGQSAKILYISEHHSANKLIQLGLTPGKNVTFVKDTLFGHALYFKIGFNQVALRSEEADLVIIEPLSA